MNDALDPVWMQSLLHVRTTGGRLVGLRHGSLGVFKGIAFAAAPVGALRWRPPQRAPRWEGVRPAFDIGPAPMQDLPSRASLLYRLNHDEARDLVMSEDCLYLNVWSPEPSPCGRLPVLVWVHGGGNRTGHGGQDLFDGARLAARGLVVVTLNMRLGALGFLSLPELAAEDALGASGNYGLQDVVAALEWVQENIASFGGDPARVTLGGNSSGASSVTHLMAAPSARGLFRAAIGQSVSGIFRPDGQPASADVAARGRSAVAALGDSLEQLREQPATAFLRIPPQGVVVDGRLLTEDTTRVFLDGRQAAVPLLAGWNADEGSLYASPQAAEALELKPDADEAAVLARVYPAAGGQRTGTALRALVGDRRFAYPVWRWARTHSETARSPAWLYEFDHALPLQQGLPQPMDKAGSYGAFHTAELPYTWDNLFARRWAWREADHALATRMADAWARFVIDGDPNGPGLPHWASFDAQAQAPLMVLGEHPRAGAPARPEGFAAFDAMSLRALA